MAFEEHSSTSSATSPASSRNADGTWSSGRVLSAAQRDRKRQLDRINKSKRRQDDQRLVENLKAEIDSLTAKVKALEQQAVEATAQPNVVSTGPSYSAFPTLHDRTDHTDSDPDQPVNLTSGYISELPSDNGDDESTPALPLPGETALANNLPIPGLPYNANPGENVSIQDLFNYILGMALLCDRRLICRDEKLSQDAIIRGVLHGWDTVLSPPYTCPIWDLLARFDYLIFGFTPVNTRFSTLKTLHTFCLYLAGMVSVQSLPMWHRPRPTQTMVPHDLAVDILAWPGLRERGVMHPETTKSNKFWRELIQGFELHWPYAPEEAYQVDPTTGLYTFSGLYVKHVREIRMWTMSSSFFRSFPTLVEDMVIVPPIYLQPHPPPVRQIAATAPYSAKAEPTNEDSKPSQSLIVAAHWQPGSSQEASFSDAGSVKRAGLGAYSASHYSMGVPPAWLASTKRKPP
ncbi:uncharacterized protein HMPREF1541_07338 [Cyphellophora europaea CBS 101466]|uniref:BZIP domain-containing protein n=1 Tax=Cyphellophora europaea (strain CBS 101466) TaxID=1220924 RepID=W2RN04_CYPE1|nr:uncharacterized protein HMPREF1541_07338 [Cyphellophora europaea CBS 101466]ETN37715.1 hypothetical protein HMPREF1541_07338 [Cyphellophora europaea CBS 101466]